MSSAAQELIGIVDGLPEEKAREVVAAIQKGLDSLDRGEGKSIDEVEKLVASWTTK
jgi:hypothetical protein